ncbi:MAG: hypothetical protein Q9164_003571 [Protoblastenia rupestris]
MPASGERINTLLQTIMRPVMAPAREKAVRFTASTKSDGVGDVVISSDGNLDERGVLEHSRNPPHASTQSRKARPRVNDCQARKTNNSDSSDEHTGSSDDGPMQPGLSSKPNGSKSCPIVSEANKTRIQEENTAIHVDLTKKSRTSAEDIGLSNPSVKRRRSSRGQRVDVLSYDLSHHPLDSYTRPKAVARKKSKARVETFGCKDSEVQENKVSNVRKLKHESLSNIDKSGEPDGRALRKPCISTRSSSTERGRRKSARSSMSIDKTSKYDMSWHPADTVIRPQAAAWRQRKGPGLDTVPTMTRDQSDRDPNLSLVVIDNAKGDELAPVSSPPKRSRDENQICGLAKPPTSCNFLQPDSEAEEDAEEPHRRRSSRTHKSSQPLIYNARFHPADVVLRPSAASKYTGSRMPADSVQLPKHRQRGEIWEKNSPSHVLEKPKSVAQESPAPLHHGIIPATLPTSILPSSVQSVATFHFENPVPTPPNWSHLHNPYVHTRVLDWNKLQEIDRCIYRLQKGAPLNSKTLPLIWQHVKDQLYEEGHITLDDKRGEESTGWVKARYESVRVGVQAFFKAQAEPMDKKHWTVFHAEGLNVYDKDRGRKYWRHFEDSIMQPDMTTAARPKSRQTLEAKGCGGEGKSDRSVPADEQSLDPLSLEILRETSSYQYADLQHQKPSWSPTGSTIDPTWLHHNGMIPDGYADDWEHPEAEMTQPENMPDNTSTLRNRIESQKSASELLRPFEYWVNNQAEMMHEGIAVSREPNFVPRSTLHTRSPVILQRDSESQPSAFDSSNHSPGSLEFQSASQASMERNTSTLVEGALEVLGDTRDIESPYKKTLKQPLAALLPSLPIAPSQKRKSRSKSSDFIQVHEDQPGRTPLVKKIVANHPLSPGTDLPKENLSSQERLDQSNGHIATEISRSIRRRLSHGTPGRARMANDARTGPHRNIFGGD